MPPITEIEALQNAANSCNIEALKVNTKYFEDKRKSIQKYFLTINGVSISPILDYEQMNHFILGFSKAMKFNLEPIQTKTPLNS